MSNELYVDFSNYKDLYLNSFREWLQHPKCNYIFNDTNDSNNDNDNHYESDSEHICLCKRCNRKITDENSIKVGMGPTCYQKYLKEINTNKLHILF